MPSTRNEEYRYTDISSLLNSALAVAPADAAVNSEQLQQLAVPEAAGSRVVLVNGTFRPELSDLSAVGEGVYVGGAAGAPADVLQQLVSAFSAVRSSFAALCLRTSVAWHGMAWQQNVSQTQLPGDMSAKGLPIPSVPELPQDCFVSAGRSAELFATLIPTVQARAPVQRLLHAVRAGPSRSKYIIPP